MSLTADLATQLAAAARSLSDEPVPRMTAQTAVELSVTLLHGCDAAGITHLERGHLSTIAYTHPLVLLGDELQLEVAEGPCLGDGQVVHEWVESRDLATEERWPAWAQRVTTELGIRSMVSFSLFTTDNAIGWLNLYSHSENGFTDQDILEGHALAVQAAAALSTTYEVDPMQVPVHRRTVLGQAEGILMERFGIGASEAFSVLVRLARQREEKLFTVAEVVATTREVAIDLDGTPRPDTTDPDPVTVEAATGHSEPLQDRTAILRQALQCIDEHGTHALTMVRLANSPDVDAWSLHAYFSDDEDLRDAVVAHLFDGLEHELDAELSKTWQGYLQALAHEVRHIARQHPHAFVLVGSRRPADQWLRPPLLSVSLVEQFLEVLTEAGFDDACVVQTYRAFNNFLFGQLLLECGVRGSPSPPLGSTQAADAAPDPGPAAADPSMTRVRELHRLLAEDHSAEDFETGLETLLDRMEMLVAQ